MEAEKNVSVVILAAGSSERMASPKAFLKFDANSSFIEKIIDTYNCFSCRQIVVVFNAELYQLFCKRYSDYLSNDKLRLVLNEHPEFGRFSSVKKGIAELDNVDYCFLQNIDNPFVNTTVLEHIYSSVDNNDYYVPAYAGKGGHPVLINKRIIQSIKITATNTMILNEFLHQFNRKNILTQDKSVLYNINTADDYRELINYLRLK